MTVALIFLLAIGFGVALMALVLRASSRVSRWAEDRYVRNFEKNREAMRVIPKAQQVAFYVALSLALFAFLTWNWSDGRLRLASLLIGLTAVGYIGWFSIRWRHLR